MDNDLTGRSPGVPVGGLFVGVADLEDVFLFEGVADDLQAYWQPARRKSTDVSFLYRFPGAQSVKPAGSVCRKTTLVALVAFTRTPGHFGSAMSAVLQGG